MSHDVHVHLNDEFLSGPFERLNDMSRELVVGTHCDDWDIVLSTMEENVAICASVGVHPWFVDTWRQESLSQLEGILSNNPLVGVGEIGLDTVW
eukprot:CAMPEP_0203783694 /NCGR_PEP_ID=MMETSP0100_2-20121128/59_1 /ASSEMBLY_ACC=CAM_ASM_000210 /TAXON_ID=96639 /ORGANISM=" , Strain NY0313808BC1" /LENGTH=93 /DNA_ID=CAMNT_0050685605 /DNA_START=366 /DNA_END=644 /DNA_ORIENTATION=+